MSQRSQNSSTATSIHEPEKDPLIELQLHTVRDNNEVVARKAKCFAKGRQEWDENPPLHQAILAAILRCIAEKETHIDARIDQDYEKEARRNPDKAHLKRLVMRQLARELKWRESGADLEDIAKAVTKCGWGIPAPGDVFRVLRDALQKRLVEKVVSNPLRESHQRYVLTPEGRKELATHSLAAAGSTKNRSKGWSQTKLDEAIRKHKITRAQSYDDLVAAVERGDRTAIETARKMYGRNALAKIFECPPAMVSKSDEWRSIAEDLQLSDGRRGKRWGRKVGFDAAIEQAAIDSYRQEVNESAADETKKQPRFSDSNRDRLNERFKGLPPSELEAIASKLVNE